MDDKKNENEKVMKYINTKLKDGEIPLMLQDILTYNKSNTEDNKLIITSSSLFVIERMSVKRYFKAAHIQFVALTPYSNQMAIFYDPKGDQKNQAIRFESEANFKVIQDIVSVRQKFCQMKQPLPVMVCPTKSLQSVVSANESGKSKFFGFFFKKKQNKLDIQRLSGEGDLLYVTQQNFALEIGEKMYNQIYKNVKLLYISNTQSFRFFEEKYNTQEINPTKKIFRLKNQQQEKQKNEAMNLKRDNKKAILLRKIVKKHDEEDKIIANSLRKYKNEEYKQELLFAIQTETHFEVLTVMDEGERDCQSLLNQHQFLSEKDLRSIFFKLVEMIENSQQIFCSLSPENIIVGRYGFRISKIFSCLPGRSEVDYFAPEEFVKSDFNETEIQLINLWKVGVLLYQLAYGNVPFSVELVVKQLSQDKQELDMKFPVYSLRTQEFQTFVKSIFRMDPYQRGMTESLQQQKKVKEGEQKQWKRRIMQSVWIK